MSETKFTKGKWVADFDHGYITTEDGTPICSCFDNVDDPTDECDFGEEESVFNTHLVRTSPELYEALEEVRTWISNWNCPMTDDPEWNTTEEKMEAALKKARGERTKGTKE